MTTTKVYRVMIQDNMIRHHHFATKGEAQQFSREWVRDNKEHEPPEIDTLIITLNARGIAQALDDFIDLTCANEG